MATVRSSDRPKHGMRVRVRLDDGDVSAVLWDRAPGGCWWATWPGEGEAGAYPARTYVKIRKTGRGWIPVEN